MYSYNSRKTIFQIISLRFGTKVDVEQNWMNRLMPKVLTVKAKHWMSIST